MDPLISEFSYGYAVTEELVAGIHGALRGAPIFPSLYQEGRRGGYDVEAPLIGSPAFLQFKLSHYMVRRNASEWFLHHHPYYRMFFRPSRHSRQHKLLVDWERIGNAVFYVAPTFHTPAALNSAYLTRTVISRSVFISPNEVGHLPDDGLHYVTFRPTGTHAYFHSKESRPIKPPAVGTQFLEGQLSRVRSAPTRLDQEAFEKIAEAFATLTEGPDTDVALRETISKSRAARRQTRLESARFAALLSRAVLDAQLLVLFEAQ